MAQKNFTIDIKSGMKDMRKNLKQVQKSLGKDLTRSVVIGLAFEARQGALAELNKSVNNPRTGTAKSLQYTAFDTVKKASTVGFNVKTTGKNRPWVNSALSNIVYGASKRFSGISANRLMVPVAEDAKDKWGNLNKRTRGRIQRAKGNVNRGRYIHFEKFAKGVGIFEGYRKSDTGRKADQYDTGRRLLAWAPNKVTWDKTFDFHEAIQRTIDSKHKAVFEREYSSYLKNKLNKIIRQGKLVK